MKREISLSTDLRLSQERLSEKTWVLFPLGTIDSVSSEEFGNRIRKFLDENGPSSNLLLDMSGVKYISSIGLGALISLLRKSKQDGSEFGVYNPQLAVRRVLEISKLDFLLVKTEGLDPQGPFTNYVQKKEAEKALVEAAKAQAARPQARPGRP